MGRDAIDLGAVAVGPEELLDGELEGARFDWGFWRLRRREVVLDRDDALDGALAERAGVADDQAPAVVLDHAREDLRGAGAGLVDQDDERTIPGRAFVVIIEVLDAEDLLDLDDRARCR